MKPAKPRASSTTRKPSARGGKAPRATLERATFVFRDFVRQLEKLDTRAARPGRGGTA
ncbi:hypothetical protein [Microvirga antarctica]|uniref:hypothetical protein n=1 Tax=Microvirga antarctica TaxID=2819233 RepID=UPI001B307A7E|nr:hypothetical protein [Microvirga antarctica]